MSLKYKIRTFIQKKLDKYRLKMKPWLKRFLLEHRLLELKPEVLQNKKSVSYYYYNQSTLSKIDILREIFYVMSSEFYTAIQHAVSYGYKPQINSFELESGIKIGDADIFTMRINTYYSPYNYLGIDETRKLFANIDRKIGEILKENL